MNVNKIILGTVQFGLDYGINNISGKISSENIEKILNLAFTKGIRILDTAEIYGDSQKKIGNYHFVSPNKFKIVTKFNSNLEVKSSFSIEKRVLENLKTLNVDYLYGYMFHSFEDYDKYFEQFKKELVNLKSKGIIKKIGVSIYENEELEKVIKNPEIDLVQLPYNLLDNDLQRKSAILKAKEFGIEIHTRSAFMQGLFFKSKKSITGNLMGLKNELNEIENIAKSKKIELSTLALNYPVSKKYIDKVLIGVDNVNQLEQNLNSLINFKLDSNFEEIDQIEIDNKKLLNPSKWKV